MGAIARRLMSQVKRPVSILIAALGGQGGGVLTEWLMGAAAHAGGASPWRFSARQSAEHV